MKSLTGEIGLCVAVPTPDQVVTRPAAVLVLMPTVPIRDWEVIEYRLRPMRRCGE